MMNLVTTSSTNQTTPGHYEEALIFFKGKVHLKWIIPERKMKIFPKHKILEKASAILKMPLISVSLCYIKSLEFNRNLLIWNKSYCYELIWTHVYDFYKFWEAECEPAWEWETSCIIISRASHIFVDITIRKSPGSHGEDPRKSYSQL